MNEDYLKTAFEYFDKDGSGSITLDELREVLSSDEFKIPDEEIGKMINEVDHNKDNCVDYKEFISMMKSSSDWSLIQCLLFNEVYD